jgi:hypothetical protein
MGLEVETEAIDVEAVTVEDREPEWAALTAQELRKVCRDRSIKWRDVHGKGKHLRKGEMLMALAA